MAEAVMRPPRAHIAHTGPRSAGLKGAFSVRAPTTALLDDTSSHADAGLFWLAAHLSPYADLDPFWLADPVQFWIALKLCRPEQRVR